MTLGHLLPQRPQHVFSLGPINVNTDKVIQEVQKGLFPRASSYSRGPATNGFGRGITSAVNISVKGTFDTASKSAMAQFLVTPSLLVN